MGRPKTRPAQELSIVVEAVSRFSVAGQPCSAFSSSPELLVELLDYGVRVESPRGTDIIPWHRIRHVHTEPLL